jgi:hypothetical protein
VRIQGVLVDINDAAFLASALQQLDGQYALTAGAKIYDGLRMKADVNLTRSECQAVLVQLVNPPDGLADLRRALSLHTGL